MAVASTSKTKPDQMLVDAVDQARSAAEEAAADFGVGEHQGTVVEGDRLITHHFSCEHPGYPGWSWAVTMVRASRARVGTVSEVTLIPAEGALRAPRWVPWSDRIQAGDVTPGTLMPTPDNDPRLEPGYTGGELATDADPAEWSQIRAVIADLGLGRERVLTAEGRRETAERWQAGAHGADNQSARQAPAACVSCGYFQRLTGSLGTLFGACTNEFSPADSTVVAVDYGCGGHSDVVADERGVELEEPVFDTLSIDQSLFD